MLFSLRQAWTGEWLGGPAIGKTLTALAAIAVVGSVVVCLLRGGRHMALAIGVLAYPVILALSKQSFFWQDGRYAGYDVPLLSLVMAAGVDQVFGTRRDMAGHLKRSHRPKTRMVLAGVAAAVVGLSLANFSEFVVAGPGTKWGKQPDAQTAAWARGLESAGVTVGFANYWVAFNLDLLSGEKLRITGDPNRWSALTRQVRESPTAAWLFVQPSTLTFSQFAVTPSIDGPGLTEPTFLSYLHRAGYHYKRIRVGPIDAVIPDHRLIPEYVIASA
jgi:hypothetical protein